MADEITAFLVKRDADGKPEPYEVDVLGIQEVPLKMMILPTTVGSMKGLKDPNGDVMQWPVEDKVKFVRDHVVEPAFGTMSPEELENSMTMWDLDMVLFAAVQKGGPHRLLTPEDEKLEGKKGQGKRGPSKKRRRR